LGACDISIHDHGDGNPHAHLLITTRRLEVNCFSNYKARDLNPTFYSGKVVEQDYWGEQWRDAQNMFFKENNLNLSVDLNHIISERHEGQLRNAPSSYVKEENEIIREERVNIALHQIDNLINQLSQTNSVFTRRDIEKLLFKTLSPRESHDIYLATVEKILGHYDVISLGMNDAGLQAYTTRHQYISEAKLLKNIQQMTKRHSHVFSIKSRAIAQNYTLNDEQHEALTFITEGRDLSILIGRPGTGKSYLLKPMKEHYEAHGYRVMGASLSGKVAKTLEADTGIKSYTMSSLNYRLSTKTLQLTKDDVIIIDEAGMIDFANLSYLLDAANKARAKVVLVGDPDQLKPIHKGEIFRAIAERVGYIELGQIRRQVDAGDRAASLALAKGQISNAIRHYEEKGAIHFLDFSHEAASSLVNDWHQTIGSSADIKEHVMFAFTRAAVKSLNEQAREALQHTGIIHKENIPWLRTVEDTERALQINDYVSVRAQGMHPLLHTGDVVRVEALNPTHIILEFEGQSIEISDHYKNQLHSIGQQSMSLAEGERILFRKNDKLLGVRNGDMAFITSINADRLVARLDTGESVTIPKSYTYIDHGYATTVHKGQGMTVDDARVLIDSQYWDKNLSFVALTRHRKTLGIYADKHQHPDINALHETLSRSSTKDNVIDWPLDFAIRAGFDPDKMIGRALNHIVGLGHTIKTTWNYLVNYESYLKEANVNVKIADRQVLRAVAKDVAGYLDEKYILNKDLSKLKKEAKVKQIDEASLPQFETIYERSIARDKRAYELMRLHETNVDKLPRMARAIEGLKQESIRYERYMAVQTFAEVPVHTPLSRELMAQASKIDLIKDYVHIHRLSDKYGKTPTILYQQIDGAQKAHKRVIFEQLKKEYPILNDYDVLVNERRKVSGFKGEQLDKALVAKAREIMGNNALYERLQQELPKMSTSLAIRIKANGKDKDIEH
jgi:Ti-type conjugative transfer relaxase TraA